MRGLAIGALLLALLSCGSRTVVIDKPDQMAFGGRTYLGVVPSATKISEASAVEIGTATSVAGRVTKPTVYGLDGVDPASAVAMRLDDGTFMAFVGSTDGRTPALSEVGGMCEYAVDEPGC